MLKLVAFLGQRNSGMILKRLQVWAVQEIIHGLIMLDAKKIYVGRRKNIEIQTKDAH